MKELGMVLLGTFSLGLFCATVIYPNLEYKGGKSNASCTGQCYVDYVEQYGTVVEIEQRKQQLANADEFSSIRSLWAGCAACHGPDGGGGIGPKLSGQTADYISDRLITYKNNGTVGAQSALMWGQAAMLSSQQIETLSKYIEKEL
jgi:cytochrome c553|tara:strand:+ start:21 stop:458 length:438 start_codon:yes stop_codon:yes gene_type:complete